MGRGEAVPTKMCSLAMCFLCYSEQRSGRLLLKPRVLPSAALPRALVLRTTESTRDKLEIPTKTQEGKEARSGCPLGLSTLTLLAHPKTGSERPVQLSITSQALAHLHHTQESKPLIEPAREKAPLAEGHIVLAADNPRLWSQRQAGSREKWRLGQSGISEVHPMGLFCSVPTFNRPMSSFLLCGCPRKVLLYG